jgi:hypothetical protein
MADSRKVTFLDPKIFLSDLLSHLVNVPDVDIESTINGETVGFAGPITSISFGKIEEPWVYVNTDYGYQFGVTMENLVIKLVKDKTIPPVHVYTAESVKMHLKSEETTCPECGEPQFECPGGLVCKNGHGF